MNKVVGVGKDEPTVVNELGGRQSRVHYRFDLLDPKAMFEMTKVLKEGADKYGADNWRNIPVEDHLNHLIIHAYAYLAGDRSDEHLSHVMCRAMFAQAVDIDDGHSKCYEDSSCDDLIHCGNCRRPTIPRSQGEYKCNNCGQGQSITVVNTGSSVEYHSNPL